MEITETAIPDIRLFKPVQHGDHRGFFSETYNKRRFAEAGVTLEFVQDNHSLSRDVGTLRGLHYQAPPMAQDKLVRVVKGSIFDVAVDLRKDSPTFGRHVSAILSAENWTQMLVPVGFAHGFCTLEPDTEVIYKVTEFFSPDHDLGIRWNDPALGIDWPATEAQAVLSDRDRAQPFLKDIESPF